MIPFFSAKVRTLAKKMLSITEQPLRRPVQALF